MASSGRAQRCYLSHTIRLFMLYIVSTPIGNLQDISQRALDVLRSVEVLIIESPQDSLKLLRAYEIPKKEIIKYNDRNKEKVTGRIIELLKKSDAAFLSSAGTPGVSDPGSDLVRAARDQGIKTVIVPGASALAAAIAMSGMRMREFTFISFPPKKQGQLRNFLRSYAEKESVLVFFESTHRIVKSIEAIRDVMPNAHVCVAKEMTKMFEGYIEGTPEEVLEKFFQDQKLTKGEFVVLVDFKG